MHLPMKPGGMLRRVVAGAGASSMQVGAKIKPKERKKKKKKKREPSVARRLGLYSRAEEGTMVSKRVHSAPKWKF